MDQPSIRLLPSRLRMVHCLRTSKVKCDYTDLYSTESQLSNHARVNMPQMPTVTSLDDPPSIEEVRTATESLSSGKASGQDGIPAELIKSCKSVLLPSIHRLIVRCWEEGRMPQDFKDAKIVTIYKNKGDRSDCNNHRGISLLSVVGKLFARVVLRRLQVLAREHQYLPPFKISMS